MRAVQLDQADPAFPARLVERDPWPLPGPRWARVRVVAGGICGSDLHLFRPTTGDIPLLAAMVPIPFELGHEIAGVVVEAGVDCPVAPGTRVVVDPTIPCAARGVEPPCTACAASEPSVCERSTSKVGTPGFMLGYTFGLGGGWADEVLAHATMLHRLPDSVPDRGATLFEPTSIAVHGLLRAKPPAGAAVLVGGAGVIGLATLAALRALFPASEVTVLAKHDHQARAAEAIGARHVVRLDAGGRHLDELARISGSRILGSGEHRSLVGGFPYVVEAVGTPQSVTDALRATEPRGTCLMLGVTGIVTVDLTPVWLKEIALVGSLIHATDPGPHGGAPAHSIERALDVLARGLLPVDAVLTHEYALADWRRAIDTALERGPRSAIKVVLRP